VVSFVSTAISAGAANTSIISENFLKMTFTFGSSVL
jgi:hypothetical protein